MPSLTRWVRTVGQVLNRQLMESLKNCTTRWIARLGCYLYAFRVILIKIKWASLWLLVNFIMCLAPIAAYLLLRKSVPQVFSGFLSYSYTVLIVSLYLFLVHLNKNTTEKVVPAFTILFTCMLWTGIYAFFWMHNAPVSLSSNDYVNTHIGFFFALVLIPTFVMSLVLSIPLIRDSISDEVNRRKIRGAERTAERIRRYTVVLGKEGDRG